MDRNSKQGQILTDSMTQTMAMSPMARTSRISAPTTSGMSQCKSHMNSQRVEMNTSDIEQQQRPSSMNHNNSPKFGSKLSMSKWAMGALVVVLVSLISPDVTQRCQAASRNMHQISKQTNQYFLNEFCDLQSKTLRNAKKFRTNPETFSIFLTSKNSLSSVRVLPQKATAHTRPVLTLAPAPVPPPAVQPPAAPVASVAPAPMSFRFQEPTPADGALHQPTSGNGTTSGEPPIPMPTPEIIQQYQAPVLKQLNCSIIVIAPRSHGLLVTVNSIGLPHHHAKLGITLNYDSQQAQSVSLDGDVTSGKYLLTQSASSKIAINLQSFAPIDWSRVSFDILFTVYKSKANSTGCPNKSWFDCGDNICVPSSLVCDNNRNCPNGNDEMIFYRCYTPLFWSIAASTALAVVIALIILVVIIVLRRRRAAEAELSQSQFSNNLLQDSCPIAGKNGLQYWVDNEAGYLADNMTGGFENPVWLHSNNTLTKPSGHQQVPVTITSTTSTLVVPPQHLQQQQQSTPANPR